MSITTVIEIPIVTPEELEGKRVRIKQLHNFFLFFHSGSCACAVALNEIGSLNAQNYTCISQHICRHFLEALVMSYNRMRMEENIDQLQ